MTLSDLSVIKEINLEYRVINTHTSVSKNSCTCEILICNVNLVSAEVMLGFFLYLNVSHAEDCDSQPQPLTRRYDKSPFWSLRLRCDYILVCLMATRRTRRVFHSTPLGPTHAQVFRAHWEATRWTDCKLASEWTGTRHGNKGLSTRCCCCCCCFLPSGTSPSLPLHHHHHHPREEVQQRPY